MSSECPNVTFPMLLMPFALMLARTTHAKTNVSLSVTDRIQACGREFVVPDSENPL